MNIKKLKIVLKTKKKNNNNNNNNKQLSNYIL